MKLSTINKRLDATFPKLTEDDAQSIMTILSQRFGIALTYWNKDDLEDRGVKGDDEHLRDLMRRADHDGFIDIEGSNENLDHWLRRQDDVEFDDELEEEEEKG